MWFMVYLMRDQRTGPGQWGDPCNTVTKIHPVLQLKEWLDKPSGKEYFYRLLWYDKLPDDVAAQVKELDL